MAGRIRASMTTRPTNAGDYISLNFVMAAPGNVQVVGEQVRWMAGASRYRGCFPPYATDALVPGTWPPLGQPDSYVPRNLGHIEEMAGRTRDYWSLIRGFMGGRHLVTSAEVSPRGRTGIIRRERRVEFQKTC